MKLGDNRNKKEVSSEEERLQNRGVCRRSFDAFVGGLRGERDRGPARRLPGNACVSRIQVQPLPRRSGREGVHAQLGGWRVPRGMSTANEKVEAPK